jgi:hypothetical protein
MKISVILLGLAQQVVQESSQQQQQQQQNIQTLVVSADSSNLNQSNSNIQLKPSTLNVTSTVLFGQQQQHSASLSQTKSVIMPSTSTFGSSASTLGKFYIFVLFGGHILFEYSNKSTIH